MTEPLPTISIVATPTDDPERQLLTIADGLPLGSAVLDASGVEWCFKPNPESLLLDAAVLQALIDTLAVIPRPTREEMETFYRAHGFIGPEEPFDAEGMWGKPPQGPATSR